MYTVKNHTCERNDGTVKPKFSVCIDMMYADAPFDQRTSLAKCDGADAVEFWKWSNKDINLLADNLRELSLDACLMNLDSADEVYLTICQEAYCRTGARKTSFVQYTRPLP